MISIFDYFSYHDFLNDWIEDKKNSGEKFSQRNFLRQANITGSAVLHRILRGSPIPAKYIDAFLQALELNEGQSDYFKLLVEYEDAKTIAIRTKAFSGLLQKRSSFPQYKMDDNALKFFKRWYYPVVREIVGLLNGEEDYNKISRMVVPPITSIQAQNAVKFLLKNNFLKRNEKNQLELSDSFLSTGGRRKSAILVDYHLKNLEINKEAIDQVAKELVSMSSLTLSVSQETYQKMRNELADFRNKLMGMAKEDENPEQVYHLNFTFLPRSKTTQDKGNEQ